MALSVSLFGTFAVLRSQLEIDESCSRFGGEPSFVDQAPVKHLVGVHDNLLDTVSLLLNRSDLRPDLLKKLDERGRVIVAADFVETGVILRCDPGNADDRFVHGDLILVTEVAGDSTGSAADAPSEERAA